MPSRTPQLDGSARWSCDKCKFKHEPGSPCPTPNVWLARGGRATPSGTIWIKRPMPDGQWPADQRLPRDDSFAWWVRSHCGHEGGAKQWAFYEERHADSYEEIFRADPCRWTGCGR